MRRDPFNRREFIKVTAAGTIGLSLLSEGLAAEEKLPQRVLGKTGIKVPILGYGTAPTGTRRELKDAIALYNEAIDLGVNYIDTAPDFAGYGQAQVQLGYVLKERRREVFLVTKCWRARADDAMRLLERNLKELQTDYADLVYAHSIGSDEMDPAIVMGDEGVMRFLLRAKSEGLARFIGVSGHNRPGRFLKLIEEFDIDVMMTAVNFADRHTYNFEEQVWPVAARKGIGLVAMKIFGGSGGDTQQLSSCKMPKEHLQMAFRYALSLPNVCTAVVGIATRQELLQNIEWAKQFKPLGPEEMERLGIVGKELAAQWKEHFGPVS